MKDILNAVLKTVSVGIAAVFPDVPIYSEQIPGKPPERWFFISFAGEVAVKRGLAGVHHVSGKLDIAYFPPRKEEEIAQQSELLRVFFFLALGLRVVRYNGLRLRLEGHSRNETDGVLHDICSFQVMLAVEDPTPVMKEIRVDREEIQS